MIDSPLATIFGFVGTFYGLVMPLGIILVLSVLFLVSMQQPGAKPKAIGEAIYCYALHAVSIILMTIGALPTVFSVFSGVAYTGRTYIALLLVFACGGLLFLIQDQVARELDASARAVIEAIYFFTLKIIGNILALLSALSIFLSIILGTFDAGWWVTPFVLLLYGLLLSWCTHDGKKLKIFKSVPLVSPARGKKPDGTLNLSKPKIAKAPAKKVMAKKAPAKKKATKKKAAKKRKKR